MAESLISVAELNGDFESLLKIVNDKGLLNISPDEIAQLTVPRVHVQKNKVQVTFEDQWNRRMTRFSDENIKKVNMLWNTKCRDLLLQHVMSLHGYTLAEELLIVKPALTEDERKRKCKYNYQKDPKRHAAEIGARREMRTEVQVMGLDPVFENEDAESLRETLGSVVISDSDCTASETSESEVSEDEDEMEDSVTEMVPNCKGHVYDQFGFLKYHNRMQFCEQTAIQESYMARESVLKRGTMDEMLEALNSTQANEAVDGSFLKSPYHAVRSEIVSKTEAVTEVVHIPLGDSISAWSDIPSLRDNVTKLIFDSKLLPGYRFYIRHCVPSYGPKPYLTMSLQCSCSRRFEAPNDSSMDDIFSKTVGLDCRGLLRVRVYLESKILVIRHEHRHHHDTSRIPVTAEIAGKIQDALRAISNDVGFLWAPEYEITSAIRKSGIDAPACAIMLCYDALVKMKYRTSDSDWVSAQNYYLTKRSIAASYVVRSMDHTGQVVLFTDIIRRISGRIDSLALDSTYNVGHHETQLFVALATVDGTDILVGFMLINESKKVALAVNKSSEKGLVRPVDPEAPLEQCELARRIDLMSNHRFPKESKTALISSFLMLLKGTDRVTYLDTDLACQQVSQGMKVTPLPYINTAINTRGDSVLAQSPHPGFRVPLITTAKHIDEMNAANFVFPETPITLCYWRLKQAVERTFVKANERGGLTKWLKETTFPESFASVCPKLFDNTVSHPCSCSGSVNPLSDSYECLKCSPNVYDNWSEPPVSKQRILKDLLNMMRSHSRAISFLPQLFDNMKHFSNGACAKLLNAEELVVHIHLEMLEFCLERRALYVFKYLWDNWYCEKWFRRWTQCHRSTYNPFFTDTVCGVFNDEIKNIFGEKGKNMRLDEFAWLMFQEVHKTHFNKMELLLDCADGLENLGGSVEFADPLWVNQRWKTILRLTRNAASFPNESTPEFYRQDRLQFGTDAVQFVCGCEEYKVDNIHMCTHIMRCIKPKCYQGEYKLLLKFDLRANSRPPFYVSSVGLPLELMGNPGVWPELEFHDNYIAFLRSFPAPPLTQVQQPIFEVRNREDSTGSVLAMDQASSVPPENVFNHNIEEEPDLEYDFFLNSFFHILTPPNPLLADHFTPNAFSFLFKVHEDLTESRYGYLVETLNIEVARLTPDRAVSTAASCRRLSCNEATILKLPVEVRHKLLMRANDLKLFSNRYCANNYDFLPALWEKYLKLTSNSTV